MHPTRLAALTSTLLASLLVAPLPGSRRAEAAGSPAQAIEFNRDIRPILSDTCFHCHGPDQAKRKAGLRLDTEAGALADLKGHRALVPGQPEQSELYLRITAQEETQRMPPSRSGRKLTADQIDLLRRWIEQGARWQPHWSFLPPRCPDLPAVKQAAWVRNPIDAFILARLEREGLAPAPEADRTSLIRRVTLDLTGLPPTPAEVDAFRADPSPDAYERVVDRLLASPRYGERMARPWLDGARYADTSGYQSDGERFMWRWRDWVIEAFNRNLPFDRFTVEQLAGDMLPPPPSPPSEGGAWGGLAQKIASGFNRNHRGNGEGGIIPEEYAVEYVVDRVETTATVWLGLTMGCSRCHDHKYDPVTQKEFYQVFAYFNNVPEKGRAIKFGNSPPMIKAPTRDQQRQLEILEADLAGAESRFAQLRPELASAQARWEKTLKPGPAIHWTITRDLLAHYPLDAGDDRVTRWQGDQVDLGDVALTLPLTFSPFLSPCHLVTLSPGHLPPGKIGAAAHFDGRSYLAAGDVAPFGFYDKFSLAAWIYPEGDEGGVILSRMSDAEKADGYYLVLEKGKVQLNLVKRWLDDALRVETETRLAPNRWHHVLVTYDGSRVADGVRIYLDGKPERLKVQLDELNQSFTTKEPLRIGGGGGPEGRFHGRIDEVRIHAAVLTPEEAEVAAEVASLTEIASLAPARRTPGQARKLAAYYLDQRAPEAIRTASRRLGELRKQRAEMIEAFPTTMVMEEMPVPRDTFVLVRGQYDKPGDRVSPDVPAALAGGGTTPGSHPRNRLEFARWLVRPDHPLTARVVVNRFWQMYFGTGLVRTVDDFGLQGEWPSHPELLDWLATEFVRSGWDVKAMQRHIVTSATYRQSSRVSPALARKDPDNRLLGRGPRFRLPAEMVRDQALAVSGLLVERPGGPSVKPYQPAGLIKELTGTEDYRQDHGENLYRRSLYTFWKRTVAPPQMLTFDAANRETCVVRETRTNTPLQALTLMNDVTYVEAARVLAQRLLTEAGPTPEARLSLAFRLATARTPRAVELAILLDNYKHHLEEYRKDPAAALKLVSAGEYPRNEKLDVSELAAYTAVAGLILNLDEVITKE
jgi:hypothetical protein